MQRGIRGRLRLRDTRIKVDVEIGEARHARDNAFDALVAEAVHRFVIFLHLCDERA